MDWTWITSLLSLLLCILFFFKLRRNSSKPKRLPPGPSGWPIFGNMFDLGEVPHQTLQCLGPKYGPVIWLRLGAINTMVVQSAAAAAELFKNCDLAFADRKVPDSLTASGYHHASVAIGAYGAYWRKVRRICTTEFLVHKRVNASIELRQRCVDNLVGWIRADAEKSRSEIRLDQYLFVSAFNVIGNLMLSRDVMDARMEKASEFFDVFLVFMDWTGKPNLADFLPFLKRWDPQGIRRNTGKHLERLLVIASGIVKERIEERRAEKDNDTANRRHDFLDALLDDESDDAAATEGPALTEKNITIVLLEMFFGGTETTSSTVEWGMSELLRNPEPMRKLRDEMDQVVGRGRKVVETDLNNLPYLQATVKEILRLHPVFPMLLPRNSMQDTEFMGYVVPKDTQIFVNAWAIHRDPASWVDPLTFKPDRFLDSEVDYKGQDFEMLPFGSGRRACIGMTLGHRMVCLTLASLVNAFDWKLGEGVKPESVDMREKVGLTMRKLVPLKVIPIPREGCMT